MCEPGSQVGRYEIQRRLGRGGMGTVYAAHDSILGRLVAIKVFASDLDIPDARERFVREARSAAALAHPHIVAVHDFGDHESQPYIVMEYIKGETLAELILGEQVDGRADLFSIGVVFYELLAYTEAFPGDTGPAITHRILNKDPVPLLRLVPDLNPEVQPIIERALKKNVDERFPDAESFRVAVSRVRKRVEDDSAQIVAPTVLVRETPPPRKAARPPPGRGPAT